METKEYEKQLNIKEVRIGNIVYGSWDDQDEDGEDVIRYSLCKITGVDENGELGEGWSYMLENMESPDTDYYGGLYGVELNEDWLLKFGFERKDEGSVSAQFHFGENPVTRDYLLGLTWIKDYNNDYKLNGFPFFRNGYFEVKTIHQLQNLCHSLFGEELKIKES